MDWNPQIVSLWTYYFFVWLFAGGFALVAVILSLLLSYKHFMNYSVPEEQKHIVRILLMVPIYAVDSWISLGIRHIALYIDIFRDFYEAFVLWTFMRLLIAYLGGEEELVRKLESKPRMRLVFPFLCFKCTLGKTFFLCCKRGIMQYSLVKPVISFAAIVLELFGLYGSPGKIRFDRGYTYLTIIQNISVPIALYSLLCFYSALRKDFRGRNIVAQFLCIKGVLFFSFWQGILVSLLVRIQVIHEIGTWTTENVATGVQDFLICIEMLLFALAHIYAFSWRRYRFSKQAKDQSETYGKLVDETGVHEDGDSNRVSAETITTTVTPKPENTRLLKNVSDTLLARDWLKDTYQTFGVKRKSRPNQIAPNVYVDTNPPPEESTTLSDTLDTYQTQDSVMAETPPENHLTDTGIQPDDC